MPGEARMYEDLVHAIIDQRLRPGTRVNEVHLAKAYALARPRVRRVLNRLAADNIVEFKLNLGAFIRRPAPVEARDVYQARRFLEACSIETLAKNPTGRDFSKLRQFVAREKSAYVRPKPGVHRLSSEFHIVLAEVAGNEVVKEILVRLVQRCCLIQSLYMTPAGPPCLVHEHEELIEYISSGNVREALRLHNRHFDHLESSLMLDLNGDDMGQRDVVASELTIWTDDSRLTC